MLKISLVLTSGFSQSILFNALKSGMSDEAIDAYLNKNKNK